MNIVHMRAINGPNVYIYKPVMVMRLDLGEYTERDSYEFPGFVDRLLDVCPGLFDHHCAMGRPGGFVERLYGGTYLGHIIEHVALELLTQIGYRANFGKTRSAGSPGLYDVIVEYETEETTRFLLERAVELVEACVLGESFPLRQTLDEARRMRARSDLGPSTAAIAEAAKRRGIPVRRIRGSLLQLGTGKYRKYVQATMTEATSAVAVDIASDKALTKEILHMAGIRVPRGSVARTLAEAERIFRQLDTAAAVKPLNGCQGRGVSIDVRDAKELADAFLYAGQVGSAVVIEEFIEGKQYRLLVIGGKCRAAAQRLPAHVVGDGRRTVNQLIEVVNAQPDRGEDHEKPLTRIMVDEAVHRRLANRGRTFADVPAPGEIVFLRDSANLSTGGTAVDVTAELDPLYASLAERAARAIGLDVCGVDLIAGDIQNGAAIHEAAVIEVNAAPGIRMHHYPSVGQSRDAGAAIVESLYPAGGKSRVPIISVTGTNGKTTTTRMIRHILRSCGYVVGMTSTEGVYVGDDRVLAGDTAGPSSAQLILSDQNVDIAVLETARGGIMRAGLAYEQADVGVITNVALDHIGQEGRQTLEDIVKVKALVAECVLPQTGLAVLSADDPELVKLAGRLKSRVALVSVSDHNPAVTRHLARGGRALFVRDGWIIEAAGSLEWKLVRVEELPITLNGAAFFHVANALCAVAAARHLGITRQRCVDALTQFRSDLHNPGRINLFRLASGRHVISDYGHNPDGLKAVGEMVAKLTSRPAPAVIGFPGDRDNAVLEAAARVAVKYFAPLYVKEDRDTRGRKRGEVAQILVDAIAKASPHTQVHVLLDECEALEAAIRAHAHEPLIIMFHEEGEAVKKMLEGMGAVQVHAFPESAKHVATGAI
ncbi:MAG: cyanophycin synthetase [Bacilli bacterium]